MLETAILPARIANYSPADLDTLIAAGEVVWCGIEPLGEHDGRIALYLSDKLATLLPPQPPAMTADNPLTEREQALLSELARSGATFFAPLHEAVGGGYPGETLDALWSWSGAVWSPTTPFTPCAPTQLNPLLPGQPSASTTCPSFVRGAPPLPLRKAAGPCLPRPQIAPTPQEQTAWSHAIALQLLNRYGIVTRESVAQENLPGGFSADLRCAEGSGGKRPDSPRLFCRRIRRNTVRAARSRRSSPLASQQRPARTR